MDFKEQYQNYEKQLTELKNKCSEAEKKSINICEECGKRGAISTRGTWLKTLCPTHRKELGYEYKYYRKDRL